MTVAVAAFVGGMVILLIGVALGLVTGFSIGQSTGSKRAVVEFMAAVAAATAAPVPGDPGPRPSNVIDGPWPKPTK